MQWNKLAWWGATTINVPADGGSHVGESQSLQNTSEN